MLSLLCIGAPLAELHAEVPALLLKTARLQPDANVLAEAHHKSLPKALIGGDFASDFELTWSLGGGSAKAALVVAGLARHEGRGENFTQAGREKPCVALIGGVGKDEMGRKLVEICRHEGVQPFFSETDADATGWRTVLRVKAEEKAAAAETSTSLTQVAVAASLAEDLEGQFRLASTTTCSCAGASHIYNLDHLKRNTRVWDQVMTSSIVYVESVFLTVSPESTRYIAEHCAKVGKTFALNLSARYICGFFREKIMALLPYLDYVFGNEAEYMDLVAEMSDLGGSAFTIDEAVTYLAQIPRADGDPQKQRCIIVTCGVQPMIVASEWRGGGVKVRRYPVPPVRSYRFTGKDGAGDAFAGGFLYGLMRDADLDSCVQMALYAAQVAVQRTKPGFTFKDRPPIERAPVRTCD